MFSHLAFATPWLLGFLALLPLLWWLLRLTPPSPKKILFPPLALLQGLVNRTETPARSPWWLLLLRLGIAVLLILAFAKPQLDPIAPTTNQGALLIAVDNDWAAARDWTARQDIVRDLMQKAERDNRKIILLATTPSANNDALKLSGPEAAVEAMDDMKRIAPEAWPADWRQASLLLPGIEAGDAVWLAGGLGSADATLFYQALRKIAPVKVYGTATPIYSLAPPSGEGDKPSIALMRASTDGAADIALNAVAADGNNLAGWTLHFADGSPRSLQTFDLPPDLRNQIARFEIGAGRTAASTVLSDAAWEHRSVGITGDAAELDRHSLLSEIFYVTRALKPYADIHIDALDALVKANLPVIILTDTAEVGDDLLPALTAWIKQGGILVRFTGERFAAAENHDREAALLPVPLRSGGRSLGGALTWATPQKLQNFPITSPFHNLAIPADVTVSRQILAEPSVDLAAKTWAALEDGTPLITAATIDRGMSILFHVPAQSSWSNLPISGLFVEMLQKIIRLSQSHRNANAAPHAELQPQSILDAYGDAHNPAAAVLPVNADDIAATLISPQHPPGLYGTAGDSVALNLGATVGQPQALRDIVIEPYAAEKHGIDLQPALLVAAFLLLLVDFLVSLGMRGFLRLACLLLAFLLAAHPASAAADEKIAIELSSKPYLGYVRTGNAAIDHVSQQGLRGLAMIVQGRTSIDDVGVAEINPDADDLAFYPLLYWPVTVNQRPLSPEGARRVTHYLRHGGMILFDAADDEGATPSFLQQILAGVDLPPLVRVPDDHVLTHSFYLLKTFPGRFADRDFWVEPDEASTYDGVASVLYGSNGWAAAWAMDDAGRPLFPCTPGGEEQREYAYRFGLNLVIYALTGKYKNGQAIAAKILEKMGE